MSNSINPTLSKEPNAPIYPQPMENIELKQIPKPVNVNNISINIQDAINMGKQALDTSEKVFKMVQEVGDEFSKDIEKHRVEQMIKMCKYKRKDWTPQDIKEELSRRIKEEEKNYIYVKDKHLSPDEIEKLLWLDKEKGIRSRYIIEKVEPDEVIEELYPQKDGCCKCNVSMRDVNIKGIENLKVSWV